MECISPTSIDSFLGGNLLIEQPMNGYRAGMDAVLLASAAASRSKSNICELGCGVGVALLGAISLSVGQIQNALGIEIDLEAANLFSQNISRNLMEGRVKMANLDGLRLNSEFSDKFDLVISNPPFFDDESSIRGPNASRKTAYIIGAPLEKWIVAMLRLAKPKGQILLIHRADRINDILAALKNRAGDIRIFPIRPNSSTAASRIIVCATKASRAPSQIFAGLDIHPIDKTNRFTDTAEAVFEGKNLEIWDCLE